VPESAYRTFRAFFDAVAEELPALLPGELRDYRTARMGGVFKVHFGTPRRHYELWFRGGGLEIGYHLEGAPEADRAVVAVLERRLPRLQRSLGGEMRLEPFGPGWSHLYELWPATAKTPRLAGDAAARLSELIRLLEPELGRVTPGRGSGRRPAPVAEGAPIRAPGRSARRR